MRKTIFVAFIFIFIAAATAQLPAQETGQNQNSDNAVHPAFNINNYDQNIGKPLYERIYAPNDHIMDFYRIFDANNIVKDRPPKPYVPSEADLIDIKYAINALPVDIVELLKPHLLGVYFIEDMIGSALSRRFDDSNGNMHMIMLINPKVLKMRASEWITGKERSCFINDDSNYGLSIDIGSDLTGFYYIFYHEIGHLLDYIQNINPYWLDQMHAFVTESKNETPSGRWSFAQETWNSYAKPKNEFDFRGRSQITYYGLNRGPKIKISTAHKLYRRLEDSHFVTLYGSMNWEEDFAEMFAMYMSVEVLQRPWLLTVKKGDELLYQIDKPIRKGNIKNRVELISGLVSPH